MARTRFFYILILLLGGVATLALGSATSFLVLYAILLLPVASALSLALYPHSVVIKTFSPRHHVFRGEKQPFTLSLNNRGPLPYPAVRLDFKGSLAHMHAVLQEGEESGATVALPARRRVTKEYEVTFPYRGVYDIGLQKTTVCDFMGLFRHGFGRRQASARIVVYPRLLPDFSMPLSARQMHDGDQGFDQFSDHLSDIADVRKHDPSDDYRKIHWKLTAKRGEFIVKNFRMPGLSRTLVFLDTCPSPWEAERPALEDTMASLAASAMEYCLSNRQAARMVYGDKAEDDLLVSAPEDMERVLETLAMLPFEDDGDSLVRRINRAVLSREPFADLAVFTHRIDTAVCALLKDIFSSGHGVFLYFVFSDNRQPSAADYAVLDDLAAHGLEVELLK